MPGTVLGAENIAVTTTVENHTLVKFKFWGEEETVNKECIRYLDL